MDLFVNIMYKLVLGIVQVWVLLKRVAVYIAFKPIKAIVERRMNDACVGTLGTEPHNIIVHNDWLYHRMISDGSLGLGEAYIDGWWDCKKLDVFFYKAFQANLYRELIRPWNKIEHYLKYQLFNTQTVARAREVIDKHYDLGK